MIPENVLPTTCTRPFGPSLLNKLIDWLIEPSTTQRDKWTCIIWLYTSRQCVVTGLSTGRQNDVLSTGRRCQRVRVSRPRHCRPKPSVRRRVVDHAVVRTDGAAPLVVLVGNARGQNPVHLHSSKGGAPGRVCRRYPAAPYMTPGGRDGDERRSSLAGRGWRLWE